MTLLQTGGIYQPVQGGQDVHEEEVSDSSKVVNFQVPHNAAVQIYDFKSKKQEVQGQVWTRVGE